MTLLEAIEYGRSARALVLGSAGKVPPGDEAAALLSFVLRSRCPDIEELYGKWARDEVDNEGKPR